jgi:Tfp pilus assembly protein PilP
MTQPDKRQEMGVRASAGADAVDIKRVSGCLQAASYPPTDLQNWMRKVYRRLAQAETAPQEAAAQIREPAPQQC